MNQDYGLNFVGLKPHRYKYLWAECCKESTIIKAWKKLRKCKTKRKDVIFIEDHFYDFVQLMKETMQNSRPGGDPEKMFHPKKINPAVIYEHGKEREIFKPPIWEQWVHHIVTLVLERIILKFSYKFTCGSLPKRGGIYGKNHLAKVLKTKNVRYYAKLDIRHFFNKIQLKYVLQELREFIDDEWFLFLISLIFYYFPKRLPLGFYISQWLANYILSRLDWFIKNQHPTGYVRYMDDFVILGTNKRRLHRIIQDIAKRIGKIRLRLKNNYQVVKFIYFDEKEQKFRGRFIDFMGFRFYRTRVSIRKSIMLRATRFAKRLHRTNLISVKQAQSMLSRLGWFKNTNSTRLYSIEIAPYLSIRSLKQIVRSEHKRNDSKILDGRKLIYENRLARRIELQKAA